MGRLPGREAVFIHDRPDRRDFGDLMVAVAEPEASRRRRAWRSWGGLVESLLKLDGPSLGRSDRRPRLRRGGGPDGL
jgi:hypothetical protein